MIAAILRFARDFPGRHGRIMSSGTYVPQIDGMRFLAIMQVALYHAVLRGHRVMFPGASHSEGPIAYFPNGSAGVELFFFISGYIIAFPFLSGNAPTLKSFFKRRFLRLEPPYLLALFLCFLALTASGYRPADAHSFNKSDAELWQSLMASMVYMHGIIFNAPPRLNPPLWSLEIEIQFYILAPLLLAGYMAIRHAASRLVFGVVILLLAIFSQPFLIADRQINFFLISHFYAFWLGLITCDVALRHNPFDRTPRRIYDAGLAAGLLLFFWTSALFYALPDPIDNGMNLFARAISILLIYLGAARGIFGRWLFSRPWITLIGGACYSIYLIHVPILQASGEVLFHFWQPTSMLSAWIGSALLLLPLAVAAGLVYYVFIERFCMRKDWPQRLKEKVLPGRKPLLGKEAGQP
ncbi:MAG: acyltransferase family protein [Sphingobium sp.]